MLILTEDGIIAARDKWGRTPIVIGKKEGAYAATSESSSLPNLDYEIEKYVDRAKLFACVPMEWNKCASRTKGMQLFFFVGILWDFRFHVMKEKCRGSTFYEWL